jgi:regulator of replication initiation timing
VRTTSLHFRLQNLEKENELLKMENPRLRNEIDRLKIVSIYTVNNNKTKGTIKNGQSKYTGNIEHKTQNNNKHTDEQYRPHKK